MMALMRIAISADERTGVAELLEGELRRRGHEPIAHGALADDERPDWAWASEAAARDVAEGRADQAVVCAGKMIEQIEAALTRDPENGAAIAFGAMGFAILGELDRSREWIERGMLLDPDNLYMRYNLAWPLLKFFDDREGALELLEPALAKAGRNLISLAAADHNLDPLRGDPRFVEMLEAAKARVEMAPGLVDRLIASEE